MPAEIILGSLKYRFGFRSEIGIPVGYGLSGLEDEGSDLRSIRPDTYRFTGSDGLITSVGVPITSWFLARLAYLTSGSLGLVREIHCEEGEVELGIVVHRIPVDWEQEAAQNGQGLLFDVREFSPPPREHIPLAHIIAYCSNDNILADAVRLSQCELDEIYDTLLNELLAAPNKLEKCCITVLDTKWLQNPERYEPTPDETSRNEYGWDGKELLGKHNIKLIRL